MRAKPAKLAKPGIFHSDSRKPFPEETPVLDAAQRAAEEIANKYGKAEGEALFTGIVRISANPTVHSAVDLMRQGGVALAQSSRDTHADAVVTWGHGGGLRKPARRSVIDDTNNEAAKLLRSLGLATR